jgi:hypothetical protein
MTFWGKLEADAVTAEPSVATVTTSAPAAGAGEAANVEVKVDKAADQGDKSLPDPTGTAAACTAVLLLAAIGLAILVNEAGWTARAFDPAKNAEANFALFAGFYVGAQVIERLMEFVAPVLPPWKIETPVGTTPEAKAARAARVKADRAKLVLGVSSILGVAASGFLGLFFLRAIGMQVSNTVDTILTGVTIAAGTKPLHDFISTLQNKDNPKTATAA